MRLSSHELLMASTIGSMRQISALKNGYQDKHGYNGNGWGPHIEGACGELAVAKELGIYWDGSVNTFKSPDVGSFHVRTRSDHQHDLIIRRNDDPAGIYILVTGVAPEYFVRGWIRGEDGQDDVWLHTYGGREEAWFVPAEELAPISTLRRTDSVVTT